MNKIKYILYSLPFYIFCAKSVSAQNTVKIDIKNPGFRIDNIGMLIGSLIALILTASVIISFVFLIWGGVQWIISGGDKSGVEAAQHRIQAALVGLFIVFVSWALFTIVGSFLGFSITNLTIQTPF